MNKLLITPTGKPLNGKLLISGSKNSALPILAASLLCESTVALRNIPDLFDVNTTIRLLEELGCQTVREGSNLTIQTHTVKAFKAPYELVKTMRASILVLGPLLARYGQAEVSLPGGCAIGSRPVDMHLAGLRAMGAEIHLENGYIYAKSSGRLKGTHFVFDNITVNGTQNLMMAASLAEGTTILENAAREPEVIDLANFLIKAGVPIEGVGTSRLEIQGVSRLESVDYRIIADRIQAGTYLIAATMTQGDLTLEGIEAEHLEALILKLQQAGASIQIQPGAIRLQMAKRPLSVDMTTAPHPGFATDLQAQFMALNTIAEGSCVITETIFENRFMHVQELIRMGADIKLKGNSAIVTGVDKLSGAQVMATDLRASAALVLAGLVAEGETLVDRIYHLDRGYEHIEKNLDSLGAKIRRMG